MIEAEWLIEYDPVLMLEFLRSKSSDRKLRLSVCACVRRIWRLLEDDRSQEAVEEAERFADGIGWPQDRRELCHRASEAYTEIHDRRNEYPDGLGQARIFAAQAAEHSARTPEEFENYAEEVVKAVLACSRCAGYKFAEPDALVSILRDIFGNPFRPVTFSSVWRTSTAVALAGQMYESRDFGAMPILADALQDAGCDSADVLNHCREAAVHVRGCWVVDLVLGKE
ncbi:hypothetical protein VT84_23845 [Gemmata sp. SH-PL17]|uniref:hypothetical protein n=1 Tax=Gemmata sp. SH-PL17 TaxID=1630693 RepID=UPI00078B81C3|nr:hypothetical protein [Gemmata sp. SH-PL17]AMV27454.1 hypothetical protein VT84_23845 [Gemmata sp. SH-PL17]